MAKAGRPKTETTDLIDGWEDIIISIGEVGGSVTEMFCAIGLLKSTGYEMIKRDIVFSDTFTRAKQLSQVWWEKKSRLNLDNKEFNTPLYNFNMKNRFREDYNDKLDLNHTGKMEVTKITRNIIE